MIRVLVTNGFWFSPDGRSVVFTNRGPGTDGSDAPQLFTLDLRSGAPQQVTTFTASSVEFNPNGLAVNSVFLSDDRIAGFVYDRVAGGRLFTIRRDGSELRWFDPPGTIDRPSYE